MDSEESGQNQAQKNPPEQSQSNSETLLVRVKLLSNEVYDFNVNPQLPVSEFKKLVQQRVNVPVQRQRLVFGGKQLLDAHPISEYIKESGNTLHLIAKSIPQPNEQPQSQATSNPPQAPQQPRGPVPPMPIPPQFSSIFGMVNNLMSGSPPSGEQLGQTINSLMGNLGITVVQTNMTMQEQPGQDPRNQQRQGRPNQGQTNQAEPAQGQPQQGQNQQRQGQPHHHVHLHNHPSHAHQHGQGQQGQRPQLDIHNPILSIQNAISRVNLPPEQLIPNQNRSLRDQTLTYLRRLQTQMLRFIPQLSRGIQLLGEGRTTHLPDFLPIFGAFNHANSVAIEAINRLLHQVQYPNQPQVPTQNQPQSHQTGPESMEEERPNVPQTQVPNTAVFFGQGGFNFANLFQPQQPPQQPPQQQQQSSQQQQPTQQQQQPSQQPAQQPVQQATSSQLTQGLPIQQQQPVAVSQPPTQEQQPVPSNQQPPVQQNTEANPLAGINLMSVFSDLQQNGGMGQLLGMSLGAMLQQQGAPSTIYSHILRPISGSEVLGCFLHKDFSFIGTKRSEMREGFLAAISLAGSRQQLVSRLTQDLQKILLPREGLRDIPTCERKVGKIIRTQIEKVLSLLLDGEGGSDFSNKVLNQMKLLICGSIQEAGKYADSIDLVFGNIRVNAIAELERVVPGLAGLFYGIVERDLVRIYRQHLQEERRRRAQSEEEAQSEAELLQRIQQSGEQDAESMGSFAHSRFYYSK